jgi:hypothetical protein
MLRTHFKRDEGPEPFDALIAKLEQEMLSEDLSQEDYERKLKQLERLTKLRGNNATKRVSPDTLLIVGGNLLGILLIVAYEQKHVLTSKGLSHIIKPK